MTHIVKADEKRSRQKLTEEEVIQVCYDLRVLKMKPRDTQVYKDGKVKVANLYAIKNGKIYKKYSIQVLNELKRREGASKGD